MLGLLERSRAQIRGFVDQRDDLIAVASCRDADTAVLLKLCRDVEDASDADVVLLFADAFVAPGPYVSVAVERLAEQHRVACAYAEEQGRAPLPSVPEALFDDTSPPGRRLFDAVVYAMSLVPRGGGNRLVWVMCPPEIADREAWLDLVRVFLPDQGVEPWMAGLRLMFRDDLGTAAAAPDVAGCARVRLFEVDFGQESIERGLEEDAQNEELPEAQRMQALLSIAVIDGAHGRLADAASRYETLLGYYQQTANPAMQAFVINAFGDLCRAEGDIEKAQHWYECAVTPANEARDAIVLAAVTKNLGELAYEGERYEEAEAYFDGLDRLAAHMLQPETKVRALEWRGLSLEQLGRPHEAAEVWESAATLCRNIGMPGLLRTTLEHLERVYDRTHRPGALRDVQEELASIGADEEEG
jgi:tetratricopeptide (TPR) repeat protein